MKPDACAAGLPHVIYIGRPLFREVRLPAVPINETGKHPAKTGEPGRRLTHMDDRLDEIIDETKGVLKEMRERMGLRPTADEAALRPASQPSGAADAKRAFESLIPPDMRKDIAILVVDDNAERAKEIASLFQGRGYAAETAANGDAALARMRAKPFHILITELRLPVLSGKALIAITKREFRDAAVLVATGHPEDLPLKDAFALGVDEYLTRPLGKNELLFTAECAYYRHRAIITASLRSDRLLKLEREIGQIKQRENTLQEELAAAREREAKVRQELIAARRAIAEIKQTLDSSGGLRKLLGLE